MPLGQALREYAGAANRDTLLSLLVPVQRAAETLRLAQGDGRCRRDLSSPALESARRPRDSCPAYPTWKAPAWSCACPPPGAPTVRRARRSRRRLAPARRPRLGLDALLDFRMDVTLDGEPLTDEEIAALLAGTDTLVLLRGQWVEIDRERLERAMRRFREAQDLAEQDGLTFAEAMRLLAGAAVTGDRQRTPRTADWSQVTAGPWLAETLKALRAPDGAGRRSRPGLEGNLAALPEGGRALAASAVRARPGRLPRRRHGARQDDPGPVAAAGRKDRTSAERASRACWWRRRRCSPTGRRRSSGSRPA